MRLGIGKAIKNIFKNAFMSFASVFSITSTLIILGIITALILNVNQLTTSFTDMFNTIRIEISDVYNKEEITKLGEKLKSIENVDEVHFISKEQAFEEAKELFGDNKASLQNFSKNPMSNSYKVIIKDVNISNITVEEIREIDLNNTVYYSKEVVERLLGIINTIRYVGLGLIVIFLITTIFVVHNTIRVSISSRKIEIEIMRHIGATRGFIRRPYIVEGIILGLIGAIISSTVIYFGYQELSFRILTSLENSVDTPLLDALYIIKRIGLLNIIIGIGVGMIGSIFSVRRYLSV